MVGVDICHYCPDNSQAVFVEHQPRLMKAIELSHLKLVIVGWMASARAERAFEFENGTFHEWAKYVIDAEREFQECGVPCIITRMTLTMEIVTYWFGSMVKKDRVLRHLDAPGSWVRIIVSIPTGEVHYDRLPPRTCLTRG